MESELLPPSMIARLLEEISWEKATKYRRGGRGMENVLTAEVLFALDLLPRQHFLGAVMSACSGAESTRARLVEGVEHADISLLSGDMSVNPSAGVSLRFIVQPDALFTSPGVFTFVEAKRIKTSAFQPEQLAREYVALMSNAGELKPLLFLLGVEPPVALKGLGKMPLHSAIQRHLPAVLARAGDVSVSEDELIARIDDVVCWISWTDLEKSVEAQLASFSCEDSSTAAAIQRIGRQLLNAIAWHS